MTKTDLTLGSLFDGSGGFPLGGMICGIKPIWASEIEPFPIRVTTKRLPQMKHYGDISKLSGAKLPSVDIITFGSPCQDMSIAGKRAGLGGSRSNLFYEALRVIDEMRNETNGRYPRYIVWENVPGAFSSNKGEDFKAVLEGICRLKDKRFFVPRPAKWSKAGEILADSFSLAWRTLDAQYWGVPQRRKRIYLVADLDGRSAGKILFKYESLSGYTEPCRRPWQTAARTFAAGVGKTSVCLNDQGGERMDVTNDVTTTLRAEAHHPPCVLETAGFCTEHSAKAGGIGFDEEKAPTLRAGTIPAAVYENHSQDTRYTELKDTAPTVSSTYGTGGNNQPFVVEKPCTLKIRSGCAGGGKGALVQEDMSATLSCNNDQTLFVPYGICSKDSNAMKSANPNSGFYQADTSRTIDQNGGAPSCNQGGIAVVSVQGSMIGRSEKNGPMGSGVNEDISFTLNSADKHAVAYSTSKNSHHTQAEEDLANTLVASDYKDPPTVSSEPTYIVRRLTPTECARLQGFPDDWCADLGTDEPTDDEIKLWQDIFAEYNNAVGKSTKPKTENQIRKWLKAPHSDSAEYKMWGNGVALPCVCFVLAGIVYYAQNSDQ